MVESFAVRIMLDLSIVMVIFGSLVEVASDVRSSPMPEFLPWPLSALPPCHPATALALGGTVGMLLGVILAGPLPGGRVFVGVIALIAFLFAGGFIVGDSDSTDGGYHG